MLLVFLTIIASILTALFIFLVIHPTGNFVWWNLPVVFVASFVLTFLLFLLFLIILAALHSKRKKVIKPKGIYPFFIYHVAVFLRWVYNIKVVFENKEALPKDKKFLLVLNHQSMLDPIVVISCLKGYNLAYIVKDSLIKVPFVGRYLHAAGFLPIDRKNNRKALENILLGIKRLEQGETLAIYPEGTRSKGPKVNEFRDGAFKPALKAEASIVVLAIDGFYKKRVSFPFVPAKVFLKVCEVIPYEKLKDYQTNDISEYIRNTIIKNLDEARKKYLWLQ
ncbi:MAG: lysophospholipid acyltransferase family protein [Bacilli bacterium]|jgi:1-acyl-sn-glycerol-3-phosphate acyltransferase